MIRFEGIPKPYFFSRGRRITERFCPFLNIFHYIQLGCWYVFDQRKDHTVVDNNELKKIMVQYELVPINK